MRIRNYSYKLDGSKTARIRCVPRYIICYEFYNNPFSAPTDYSFKYLSILRFVSLLSCSRLLPFFFFSFFLLFVLVLFFSFFRVLTCGRGKIRAVYLPTFYGRVPFFFHIFADFYMAWLDSYDSSRYELLHLPDQTTSFRDDLMEQLSIFVSFSSSFSTWPLHHLAMVVLQI